MSNSFSGELGVEALTEAVKEVVRLAVRAAADWFKKPENQKRLRDFAVVAFGAVTAAWKQALLALTTPVGLAAAAVLLVVLIVWMVRRRRREQ